jgi:beta-N-acetylhexosaminidase
MAFPRTLAVLAVASALVVGCGHDAARPGPSTTSSKPVAAPAPPVCGDPTTALPIRDKLAQLLMVGVKSADDARAVVNGYHRLGRCSRARDGVR